MGSNENQLKLVMKIFVYSIARKTLGLPANFHAICSVIKAKSAATEDLGLGELENAGHVNASFKNGSSRPN